MKDSLENFENETMVKIKVSNNNEENLANGNIVVENLVFENVENNSNNNEDNITNANLVEQLSKLSN